MTGRYSDPFRHQGKVHEFVGKVIERKYSTDTDEKQIITDTKLSADELRLMKINDTFAKGLIATVNIMNWHQERLKNVKVDVDFNKHPDMKAAMYCPYCNPKGSPYNSITLDHLAAGIGMNRYAARVANHTDGLVGKQYTYVGELGMAMQSSADEWTITSVRKAWEIFYRSIRLKFMSMLLNWIKQFKWLYRRGGSVQRQVNRKSQPGDHCSS